MSEDNNPIDNNNEMREGAGEAAQPKPARDLPDFHLRWKDFRPAATKMLGDLEVNTTEASTLQWLIALADRVGENDLKS